ncbi:TIGR03915 family putative DNA repair protein [Proteiniclasticum sp.]|jgi:probable DNA metabolism protein|uniref:TIGR03915 family putative DNA repair protein n=1 Tax=Proteiniclasticum sp. TaxID=2053595 RepID=UPI00289D6FFE|nr:TIGR03915 family putative DNA repair protein [Proteiniclasticum sp.]
MMNVMLFDGSMEELLVAVYRVYVDKLPPVLFREEQFTPNLIDYPVKIQFKEEEFTRVRSSMREKFSEEALDIITYGLNHSSPHAPTMILKFIIKCFENPKNAFRYQDSFIMEVTRLSRQVSLESHRFMGFVRFNQFGSVFMAKISPDHYILPFIADHFAERFGDMNFIIYDERKQEALLCQGGRWIIQKNLALNEKLFQRDATTEAWQTYFKNITISARENPTQQKRSMPVRYWVNLPETEST